MGEKKSTRIIRGALWSDHPSNTKQPPPASQCIAAAPATSHPLAVSHHPRGAAEGKEGIGGGDGERRREIPGGSDRA